MDNWGVEPQTVSIHVCSNRTMRMSNHTPRPNAQFFQSLEKGRPLRLPVCMCPTCSLVSVQSHLEFRSLIGNSHLTFVRGSMFCGTFNLNWHWIHLMSHVIS